MDLRVQWTWGGRKVIKVSEYDVVGATMCLHGFSALNGTQIFFAHRGRILDDRFTFRYHGIKPGDLIVCQLRRLPTKDKSERFLSSLAHRTHVGFPVTNERDDQARFAEQARLCDQAFAEWECHPQLPTILRDLLSDRSDSGEFDEEEPTVVCGPHEISERPLPCATGGMGRGRRSEARGGPVGRADTE
jgi:hypothetical protein